MPYWRCFYHVTWATKYRQPIILPVYEPIIQAAIERKCHQQQCQLHGLNTVSDHIHIALSIPPAKAASLIIGQLKATSSKDIGQSFELTERFEWQEGYGVLTFGEKVMPLVLDYIARQKEYHQNNTTWDYLEYTDN